MAEKKRIIILGAGIMQGPAIRIAKAHNLTVIALDANPAALCANEADAFYPVNISDKEAVFELAEKLHGEKAGLAGIMTVGTDFSTSVAWTAEKLKLPGINYETALNASDKERMRTIFKENNIPSPDFIVVNGKKNITAPPFPFPVVVKPCDNMGARGCKLVERESDFEDAVNDALKFSRSSRVIAEQYIKGREFSLDAIVHEGKITIAGFAERHIFFHPYFIEMGHTMPAKFRKNETDTIPVEIINVFEKGIKALGINEGAAKGDIQFGKFSGDTARHPYAIVGEIAARLSGGYMSGWTYPYSSNVSAVEAAVLLAVGEPPTPLVPKRNHTCAERAFISIPGKVESISGIKALEGANYIRDVFVNIKPGDMVKFPENNVEKCGNVLSSAWDRRFACRASEKAVRGILIKLKCPEKTTLDFLDAYLSHPEFPPDAFTLPADLIQLLKDMPNTFIKDKSAFTKIIKEGGEVKVFDFETLRKGEFTDYTGRTVEAVFEAVQKLLPADCTFKFIKNKANTNFLGREFWQAFVRGGYQGAVYYIESLC